MLDSFRKYTNIALVPLTLLLVVALATAADAPQDNKGLSVSKTTTVDLSSEFPGTAGLQLRLRLLTIQPGGHIGMHNHKERPTVGYVMQGTDTVIREDGSSKTLHAGDTTSEPGTTVHWHRNDGNDAVILVVTDVLKAGN